MRVRLREMRKREDGMRESDAGTGSGGMVKRRFTVISISANFSSRQRLRFRRYS